MKGPWSDPCSWGLEAERVLGSDGLVSLYKPASRGDSRVVDGQVINVSDDHPAPWLTGRHSDRGSAEHGHLPR